MKSWIPNGITLGNLILGCWAILFLPDYPLLSIYCVIGAAILDFFDGFAARLLHVSSPLGGQLDSLADVVSFGVVPSIWAYHLLPHSGINSFLPLIGLAFPVLFVINLCFLIYWLIQLKWKSLIPAAFFLFNLGQMSLYFQWNSAPEFQSRPQDLCKVVTYNANLFGVFTIGWKQDSVLQMIRTENADIICLQEVYAKNETMMSLIQRMKKHCNYPSLS